MQNGYKHLPLSGQLFCSTAKQLVCGVRAHKVKRFGLNIGIVSRSCKPVHFGFAAEPGNLPLCIVPMPSLRLCDSFVARQLTAKNSDRLSITKCPERAALIAVALDQKLCLFDQASVEHLCGAAINAVVEVSAERADAEAHYVESRQRIASALAPLLRNRHEAWTLVASRRKRYLDGANQLGCIIRMNLASGLWIKAIENTVQMRRSAQSRSLSQSVTKVLVARWSCEESFQQSAHVKARSTGYDRHSIAFGDAANGLAAETAVIACGKGFIRRCNVDQMVRHASALCQCWLGRADLETAINCNGVAGDNLARELFREM